MHYSINRWEQYYYYCHFRWRPSTITQADSNLILTTESIFSPLCHHTKISIKQTTGYHINWMVILTSGKQRCSLSLIRGSQRSKCNTFWKYVTGWISHKSLRKQSMLCHTSSQQLYSLCTGEDLMTRKTGYIPLTVGLFHSWTHLPSSIEAVKFCFSLMSEYA